MPVVGGSRDAPGSVECPRENIACVYRVVFGEHRAQLCAGEASHV